MPMFDYVCRRCGEPVPIFVREMLDYDDARTQQHAMLSGCLAAEHNGGTASVMPTLLHTCHDTGLGVCDLVGAAPDDLPGEVTRKVVVTPENQAPETHQAHNTHQEKNGMPDLGPTVPWDTPSHPTPLADMETVQRAVVVGKSRRRARRRRNRHNR